MRRLVSALAAVALAAAPTASALAQDTGETGETASGRDLPPQHWDTGLVLSVVALAVLFALVLVLGGGDDDDNVPTSP